MSKPREWWIPSVDTEPARFAYPTEDKALVYAMKRAAMSCGAIHVIEKSYSDKLERANRVLREALIDSMPECGLWAGNIKKALAEADKIMGEK